MPSAPKNRAIVAAAGARKTQQIIEAALTANGCVLVTTYTNENLNQICARMQAMTGVIPPNVETHGWFSFLLAHGIRPYQRSILGAPGAVGGLNFVGQRSRYVRSDTLAYFIDRNGDVYRDAAADLTCRIDDATEGGVIARLEQIYDHIFIDEVQDLVGYDLDVLDKLFHSRIAITVVGDPRQHTFATSNVARNKKYRGAGLIDWLDQRSDVCVQEHRHESDRCQQEICDFASALFPDFPPLASGHATVTGHDGVHMISHYEALAYFEEHQPQVLRWDKRADTQGLPAVNIGVAKGSTYDRVLIFPTKPMLAYLESRDLANLKSPEKLYVAVTRARYSVAFVT
jgi:DNA helicase II / ATP-dependent DNA helicase PcrA